MIGNFHSQKGVTLIEVLASIVLLSIILLSFMSFFTNSFKYNSLSSNKFEATNIARETQELFKVDNVKGDFRKLIDSAKDLAGPTTFPKGSFPNLKLNQDVQLDSSGTLHLSFANPSYRVLVFINSQPETAELLTSLYKIHVQVLNNTKVLSETFTYVEY